MRRDIIEVINKQKWKLEETTGIEDKICSQILDDGERRSNKNRKISGF